jgi:hypothetical protein
MSGLGIITQLYYSCTVSSEPIINSGHWFRARGAPEVEALLQQDADILHLVIHGWLWNDDPPVLLLHCCMRAWHEHWLFIQSKAGIAPEVKALLQQGADILRLLVHGWLWSDHPAVLLMHCRILNDLQHTASPAEPIPSTAHCHQGCA